MENQGFWQKYGLVLVGISLPVLLMVFVIGYRTLVTAHVDDPLYAAVYADYRPNSPYLYPPGAFTANIEGERLVLTYAPPQQAKPDNMAATEPQSKIRFYILRDLSAGPVQYDLTTPSYGPGVITLPLPPDLSVPMMAGDTAPDGYRYRSDRDYYRGGLFTEVFVGGSYRRDGPMLEKQGRQVRLIPTSGRQYYGDDLRFLGWIKEPVRP